jgi:anti-sigma B factor antagonist
MRTIDSASANAASAAIARSHVTLTGEIDLANASGWLTNALAVLASCDDKDGLTVDVSGVTFVDSTGLGMLLDIHTAAAAAGKKARFCGASEHVQRLVVITGLAGLLQTG